MAGLTEARIDITDVVDGTLDLLDARVDAFVECVRSAKVAKLAQENFHPWDYEGRFTAKSHLDEKQLAIGPHAAFWTHRDALMCFGYDKGHGRRGSWAVPDRVAAALGLPGKTMVWFPKLYAQDDWDNSLSEDGKTITEIHKHGHSYTETWDARIVMARSRGELNRTLYRFVGVFECAPDCRTGSEHRFQRISTKVGTISAADAAALD